MIFRVSTAIVALSLAVIVPAAAVAQDLGVLAPANLKKPRPKPAFDLTGTWLHDGRGDPNGWRFVPSNFKLTPEAQVHYDASQKAAKEGKVYRDDIGQCWPAGMPLILTWSCGASTANRSAAGKGTLSSSIRNTSSITIIGWIRAGRPFRQASSFISSSVYAWSITGRS